MAAAWGPPEDISLYFCGTSELDPPRSYTMSKMTYRHAGGGVFVVTLNDPKRLNCMSLNLAQELSLLIEHAKRDDRCKVVVWTGAGRAFCSGGNFSDASSTVPEDVYQGYVHAGIAMPLPDISLAGATRAMIKFPKLSIAAVNGITVGGGVNLAFVWQDFCYVAEGVTFRYPFAELGLTPELGSSVLLPKIIGLPRAKELMQMGTELPARRACELGLCTAVVPASEVVGRAVDEAQRLAAKPQFALRESKRLMNRELAESIDAITAEELESIRKAITSPETVQAMSALMRKSAKSRLEAPRAASMNGG
eukprot:CAMPEP_0204570372 /NCGR_PEP_ID=MMETSP0661-20131031/38278_1 /ASSEMBLY_ACC=CAM_ASM_000606 /TAXON_ID=109239 /ORGANISM="Alexandrium margalefi, Strain AMGDE01CS-322" /LENGTH=307 /DNA_ID=CAMNT_0051578553 /DNA_START=65 /DNA_END=986 /DNA_ORIENTATION=+